VIYSTVFDAALGGFGTLTLATSGKPNVVIDLGALTGTGGSRLLFHHPTIGSSVQFYAEDESSVRRRSDISDSTFGTVLRDSMRGNAFIAGWTSPTTLNVTFSQSTGHYTFSYGSTVFSMTFSAAAGRQLCGFQSSTKTGASSYVGDAVPAYTIFPTLPAVSDVTPNYEPDSIASLAVSDDASAYGIARDVAPLYRDWIQQYEQRAKVERLSIAGSHPWSFQHLFEHCRTEHPFVVIDGFGDGASEMFLLRDDGASWKPDRTARQLNQYHVPFRTIVVGNGTS
jgi:hypothetical protein